MANSSERSGARAAWFGLVDVVIIIILLGFVASMFVFGGSDEPTPTDSPEKLIFAVSVQSPYGEKLFLQEVQNGAVALRLSDTDKVIGHIVLGDDGVFYVECDLTAVQPSEDREGLWLLGETVLMMGESISVSSELSDFTVTVLSAPIRAYAGSVGTTEPPSETEEPEPDETPSDESTSEEEGSTETTAPESEALDPV